MRTQCSIGGCTNPRLTRGLCNKHYQRWRRHGDPSIMLTGSPETRARQSAALMGHSTSPETRAKIGAFFRGKPLSPEHRANMSAAHMGKNDTLGYRHTPEARANMSAAHMGNPVSPETRAKISASLMENTRCVGYQHSPETRARMGAGKASPVGTTHDSSGYVEIKTPDGWELEHRVVTGLTPGDGKIAHHKDGDKTNNDPSNLRVFESQAAHTRHHMEERAQAEPVGISPV